MTRSVALVFPAWWGDGARHAVDDVDGAYLSFERVVRAVTTVAPLVEVERLGCIVLAARGPSRYFGGDEALARHLHAVCADAATTIPSIGACGVGIADSRFAATAAAHLAAARGRPCVVAPSATREFIDALPVAALERLGGTGAGTVDLFRRLGLGTCGAVAAVGESALIDRFGLEGARAHRLIGGDDLAPLSPGAPPADFAVAIDTEEPLGESRQVVGVARRRVAAMLRAISDHGLQCVRLSIACHTDHGEESRRIWGEPRGFSEMAVLGRLACQLEGWLGGAVPDHDGVDTPTTGVTRVVMVPLECREKIAVQPLLWGGHHENTERAARAVALACAVDPAVRVTVPQWAGGRDLAGVYARVPVAHVDLSDATAGEQRVRLGDGAATEWSGSIPRPSPAFVLTAPRRIEVLDARGVSVEVTGRHELASFPAQVVVGERRYRVERIAGPWPVEERWWDPLRRRRHARMQVLARNERGDTGVLLVGVENREWSLLARYD